MSDKISPLPYSSNRPILSLPRGESVKLLDPANGKNLVALENLEPEYQKKILAEAAIFDKSSDGKEYPRRIIRLYKTTYATYYPDDRLVRVWKADRGIG